MAESRVVHIAQTCVISPLGFGAKDNFDAIRSGVTNRYDYPACPVHDINRDNYDRKLTRLENLIVNCTKPILEEIPDNFGVILATTKGNIELLKTDFPNDDSPVFLYNLARNVCKTLESKRFCSIESPLGIRSSRRSRTKTVEPIVISNACTSGVSAVAVASRLIRENIYDNVLVIGADIYSKFTTSGFEAFKSLSGTLCRPYDAHRDGLVLGEAVATILLTADAEKSCGITVCGSAITNDANHISGPSRTGEPLAKAIEEAMTEAGIKPADIDMINAHGTATIYNDEMESKAFNLLGLNDVPLNSLKPFFGHTLGASGVLEIVMCIEQMKENLIVATPNFETLGVPFPLNVSSENRERNINYCLKTASGFGGTNAAVILSKTHDAKEISQDTRTSFSIKKTCKIEKERVYVNDQEIFGSDSTFHDFSREVYHKYCEANQRFYKMDDFCKLGYLTAEILLKEEVEESNAHIASGLRRALVFQTRSGSIISDVEHNRAREKNGASPAIFVYTLPNIVLGEIAIRHKIQGETTMFVVEQYNQTFLENYASILLNMNLVDEVLLGYVEFTENDYLATIKIFG